MNARSAARELILMVLSQIELNKITDIDIEKILRDTVRTLVNDSQEDLKTTITPLLEMKDFIDSLETEHKTNTSRPIESNNLPVPLPLTSDMSGRLNCLINVVEKSFKALDAAELAVLEEKDNVKKYSKLVIRRISENQENIDKHISEFAIGWDINRMFKLDKNILRIAIAELLYSNDIPIKVIVNEAIELTKKYSTDESASFINGILGKLIDNKKIKR